MRNGGRGVGIMARRKRHPKRRPVYRRKKRRGEVVCRCIAYRFPHRFSGGRCTGIEICRQAVDSGHRECVGCLHFEVVDYISEDSMSRSPCAIVNGQENPLACPIVAEFVGYAEARVLGCRKKWMKAAG